MHWNVAPDALPGSATFVRVLDRWRNDCTTAVFDKQDGFSFHIVNFPHMDSNIPSKPAYRVYTSQLVRIGPVCDDYNSFFLLDTTNI